MRPESSGRTSGDLAQDNGDDLWENDGLPTEALKKQDWPAFAKATAGNLRLKRERRLERETGFEPATSTLARSHSTTELFPPAPCETIRDTLESVASVHPKPIEYHTVAVAGKIT